MQDKYPLKRGTSYNGKIQRLVEHFRIWMFSLDINLRCSLVRAAHLRNGGIVSVCLSKDCSATSSGAQGQLVMSNGV